MTIGSRIKMARMAQGHKTVKAAARAHEYKAKLLRRHENDKQTPCVDTLASYSMAFGVDMFWLATGMSHAHAFLECRLK